MIQGKDLYDCNLVIDFHSKKVKIDYGWYIENSLSQRITKIVRNVLTFFSFLIWCPAVYIHYNIAAIQSNIKSFNQKKYLDAYVGLYKFLFGTTIETFSGELPANEIVIFCDNNLEFKYELTEDYERYCEAIELYVNNVTKSFHGRTYTDAKGFFFIIRFSQIPIFGTARIEYC